MSIFNFPNQRIKESLKDEDWHRSHIESFITYSSTKDYSRKREEMANLFFAGAGLLSAEQQKIVCATITERYGDNFGPEYFVYPLIENRIEQMVGEYRTRPLKKKLLVNNEKAVIKKLDKKVSMVSEKILREINQDMQADLGFVPETEQPEMQIPENIEEFFQKDYRTVSEEIGEDILYQLLVVKKEKERIYDALRYFLTVGRVHCYLDEKDGHPSFFIPHPLDCFYDIDSSEALQRNNQYFVWDKPMTTNEIFNTFSLNEDEKEIVEGYSKIGLQENAHGSWFIRDGDTFRPRVICMEWVSRITRKFKIIENKTTGKQEYKILPEDYKIRERDKDSIKTIEIDDARYIMMVGPSLVLSYGSVANQMQTIGNPKKRFLNVVGLIDENRNGAGEIRSLAKKLKYLQDFASEILYEIRLNMRQLDGNVMVYDTSNIPKEWMALGASKALQKVQFHLKRDRIQYINTRDKKANTYASSVNVSQKGRVQELINMLGVIEDMADRISGIPKEAQGQTNPYQKATTTEVNMTSGSTRMEHYFGPFDTFVDMAQERLILKAKSVYQENDVFTFFGGDNQAKFLKIFPDFFMEDLGIHTGDNRKEFERKQRIDSIAERTFGNSQDLNVMLNLVNVFNAEHSTEAEAILRRGAKALAQVAADNQKMMQDQAAAAEQTKQAAIQSAKEQADDRLENNIDVANIYASNKNKEVIEKENNANLRKAAEIERDIQISRENSQKNKKE